MKNVARFFAVLSFAAWPHMVSAGALDKPTVPGATPTPLGGAGLKTSALDKAAPGSDPIVGRWKFGGTIWNLSADGHCHRSHPNFSEGGTWKIVSTGSPAKYEVNWSGGRAIDTIYFAPGKDKIQAKEKNGKYRDIAERAVTQ
ncbi:MAG TPA: hypothetical protein VGO11_09685 [Chthoniobacteraceae bacterium]|jgi:hypothetical protein|nr:hypothetical protein [Chthoniobacteraceae bacterium]